MRYIGKTLMVVFKQLEISVIIYHTQRVAGGILEESYFKRTPWTFGGEYGRLIVHDERSVYYVRMFDSLRGLDPTVYFTPASKGYLLFAKNLGGGRSAWSERIPVRIRAMVLAGSRLVVAGPPDVVDASDPLGAFEGRKGGLLYACPSWPNVPCILTKLFMHRNLPGCSKTASMSMIPMNITAPH